MVTPCPTESTIAHGPPGTLRALEVVEADDALPNGRRSAKASTRGRAHVRRRWGRSFTTRPAGGRAARAGSRRWNLRRSRRPATARPGPERPPCRSQRSARGRARAANGAATPIIVRSADRRRDALLLGSPESPGPVHPYGHAAVPRECATRLASSPSTSTRNVATRSPISDPRCARRSRAAPPRGFRRRRTRRPSPAPRASLSSSLQLGRQLDHACRCGRSRADGSRAAASRSRRPLCASVAACTAPVLARGIEDLGPHHAGADLRGAAHRRRIARGARRAASRCAPPCGCARSPR